jgi:hypothetical protein
MKTFTEFLEEANTYLNEDSASYERRQANKKARGRAGKTELYTTQKSGSVTKDSDGKWKLHKSETKKVSASAQLGKFRAGRIGDLPSGGEKPGPKYKRDKKTGKWNEPKGYAGTASGGGGGARMGYKPAPHSTGGINRGKKKSEQTPKYEPKLNKFQRKRAVQTARHNRLTGSEGGGHSSFVGGRAAERIKEKAKKSFGSWSKSQG